MAGHGQLVLLSGDAGIGKTALAADLLRTAQAQGMLATWAACQHGTGSPSYWPWVQTMRAITQRPEPVDLGDLVGLGQQVRRAAAGPGPDPDTARFDLFDRLAHALTTTARRQPAVVILDDLHWSDEPSLLALDFVSAQVKTAPLLLVGTYRETEAGDTLLLLASGARIIELSGLAPTDVAVLMTELTGRAPDERLANEVWTRTNGNPFLAREVTRLLAANTGDWASVGSLTGVPTGVRAVLNARLAESSPPCQTALRTAAVAGREFDVGVLAGALGWATADTVEALEEAVRRRIVVRPSSTGGRYRFVHDLFRDTAYDGLALAEAGARHVAVARSLERARSAGSRVEAAELAAQFAAAVTLTSGAEDVLHSALSYATQAAEEATSRLAGEDACDHYERALGFAVDPDSRLELLLGLGHAQYRCGRASSARTTFHSAADLARKQKDADGLARAALGWHRVGVRSGSVDEPGVALLDEAMSLVGDDAGPWPPQLLAALARNLHQQLQFAPAPAVRPVGPVLGSVLGGTDSDMEKSPIPIARRAVALARTHGDPAVLASCLLALHDAAWRPGSARERLPIVAEMATLAQECGDRELYAQARQLRAAMLLENSDPDGIHELADYCRLAEALGHQRARWAALTRRATLATLRGDLDEAHRLSAAALDLGRRIGEPDAYAVAGTVNYVLQRFGAPVIPIEGEPSDIQAVGPAGEPVLQALISLFDGDRDRAARIMSGRSFSEFPPSHDVEIRVLAAWIAVEVGTDEQRAQVYEALLPHAGEGSVVGGCAAYQGAVDHHLGALATAMGEPIAAAHLATAVDMYERLGVPAWAALARTELAALGAGPESGTARTDENIFRRDGALWHLRFAGTEVHVPDAKGLRDIATMLGLPNREIHVRALLGLIGPATGADDMLDERAKAEYRQRILALDEELDLADVSGDADRAVAAAAERTALIRELAAATGLGGRPRPLADETEKARKSVTARIRHAIARLADVHPQLAEHLEASVQTGTQCTYAPADPVTWRL